MLMLQENISSAPLRQTDLSVKMFLEMFFLLIFFRQHHSTAVMLILVLQNNSSVSFLYGSVYEFVSFSLKILIVDA